MSIKNTIGRLTLTGLISFGIGGVVTFERYNSYWNQTIFRVQTVDFNILSHTLPTKLSYAILKKQLQEVQRTLDSNYSLFGLVVTDSSGQRIIAYSGKNSGKSQRWQATLDPQQLKNHSYDVLLDPPPVFPQWTYSQPQATERSATSLTNRGRVIGRVYYVRGVRPTFQEDITTFLNNPFSGSSRIQNYATTLAACFGGTFLTWSILEFILYKKRVERRKAQQEIELAEERRQRESELAEERRNSELAIAEERRLRDLAIAEERRRSESELAEQKRLRDLEEAEKERQRQLAEVEARKQELINNHQVLQFQLVERINELQSLRKQRDDERNQFEEEANNLSSLNKKLQKEIDKLTKSLENLSANFDKEQGLKNQFKNLQHSVAEYKKREKLLEKLANQAKAESEALVKEITTIEEELLGKHPLNDFESAILNSIQQNFSDKKIFVQFDVANGNKGSMCTDFIIVMNDCCIVIEAKYYIGKIQSIGYPRNTGWVCITNTQTKNIRSCWGKNPYEQVWTYSVSLYGRVRRSNQNKLPVYGIVLFPTGSLIDDNIKSDISDFYRVITLDELTTTINELENQSRWKNRTGLSYEQILEQMTGISNKQLA